MEANAFLEALYNANYERLYIYAENLLFNAAYAEEAVQETFFEAVRKQDALMRHAKPEAWLMETLKNKIRFGSGVTRRRISITCRTSSRSSRSRTEWTLAPS